METSRGDFQSEDACEPPSATVVQAVATEKETDPTALPPLYESIDPDSLDSLLASATDQKLQIEFEYAGCYVVLDGTVEVSAST